MDIRAIEPEDSDQTDIVLPKDAPPTVEPLDAEDRKNIADLSKMEKKLKEYELCAPDLVALHTDWLTAYATWSSRLDRAYGKTEYLDQKLLVLLNKEPGEEFEEFELVSLGLYVSSGLAVASGIYGLVTSIKAWDALKTAENVTKMARFKAGGAIALSAVSLIAGAVIAVINTNERVKFLKSALTSYADWFEETTKQINEMKAAVEEDMLPRLREAAKGAGITETDDNVMFRLLIAALNAAMTDAAELEAQLRVTTRMICDGSFSDLQISAATGLPGTVVAAKRTEVGNNPDLCNPYS